jgi:hypothetical protein
VAEARAGPALGMPLTRRVAAARLALVEAVAVDGVVERARDARVVFVCSTGADGFLRNWAVGAGGRS